MEKTKLYIVLVVLTAILIPASASAALGPALQVEIGIPGYGITLLSKEGSTPPTPTSTPTPSPRPTSTTFILTPILTPTPTASIAAAGATATMTSLLNPRVRPSGAPSSAHTPTPTTKSKTKPKPVKKTAADTQPKAAVLGYQDAVRPAAFGLIVLAAALGCVFFNTHSSTIEKHIFNARNWLNRKRE